MDLLNAAVKTFALPEDGHECSKHVEDSSVTYILLMNKELYIKLYIKGRSVRVRKISPPPGFDSRTVKPVASRYTDWAIPVHARR